MKHSLPIPPSYADTLAIVRGLLPNLKNHKLDTVAAYFGQASFHHHRASDDAAATAHIWIALQEMLRKEGITDITQINDYLARLRDDVKSTRTTSKGRVRYKHIILLVRNKTGLRNLYRLITKSHLEYFNKSPVIRKSVLMQHREGLIIGSACVSGEIYDAVSERRGTLELHQLAEFYDYLEIQPI